MKKTTASTPAAPSDDDAEFRLALRLTVAAAILGAELSKQATHMTLPANLRRKRYEGALRAADELLQVASETPVEVDLSVPVPRIGPAPDGPPAGSAA